MPLTVDQARAALQVAAWRDTIGEMPSEVLVGLALDAVVAGMDGPRLIELAGADSSDPRDLRDLWQAVVVEQGIERADEQNALWQLVRHTANGVVDGTVAPIVAANWLWRSASHRMEPEGDLRIFIGLASEAEDHPEQLQDIADAVVTECRRLLTRQRPRRWLRLQAGHDGALSFATTSGQSHRGPDQLPVPASLATRLLDWQREWTESVGKGGFVAIPAAEEFVTAGEALADELQGVLGADWHVEYYPEPVRTPGVRLRSRWKARSRT
ncbi:hypothetical protein GCM10022415_15930 [Knoellia locipacati]|uniref:Uncharacterized protein n=1 Tax=Knoellia locipacati TaxID=882824 RepID=A0A512T041_9MICO|nr:hypothetical protein [Knoellia locipacati]GEQ13543.1 hypothetical protein KLO01_15900 [Knoellia locipacati]